MVAAGFSLRKLKLAAAKEFHPLTDRLLKTNQKTKKTLPGSTGRQGF